MCSGGAQSAQTKLSLQHIPDEQPASERLVCSSLRAPAGSWCSPNSAFSNTKGSATPNQTTFLPCDHPITESLLMTQLTTRGTMLCIYNTVKPALLKNKQSFQRYMSMVRGGLTGRGHGGEAEQDEEQSGGELHLAEGKSTEPAQKTSTSRGNICAAAAQMVPSRRTSSTAQIIQDITRCRAYRPEGRSCLRQTKHR
jgi:hypothetical protein